MLETAIILAVSVLVLSVAVVGIVRLRQNADEAYARNVLAQFAMALERYRLTQVPPSYPRQLEDINDWGGGGTDVVTGAAYAPLIDQLLSQATTPGRAVRRYYYVYEPGFDATGTTVLSYTLTAESTRWASGLPAGQIAAGQKVGVTMASAMGRPVEPGTASDPNEWVVTGGYGKGLTIIW